MKLFKFLKKSKRIMVIMATGLVTLSALVATTVSTMAWFSHLNPSLTGGVKSGTTSLSIQTITGYKEVDGEPKSITVTPSNEVTDNDDQGTEDTSLDVPTQGVGYYLIPQVASVYKYSNAGTTKFTELVGGSTTRAYINSIGLTAGNSYQVKKYTFVNGKTVSQPFNFGVADLYGGVATAGTNDWTVNTGRTGTYKIWLDYQNNTLGFESTASALADVANEEEPATIQDGGNSIGKMPGRGPKRASKPATVTTIGLRLTNSNWGTDAAYYSAKVWTTGSENDAPQYDFEGGNQVSAGARVIYCDVSASAGFTHIVIHRWGGPNHTNWWNKWNWFENNTMTANQYNFFENNGGNSCSSSLDYNPGYYLFGRFAGGTGTWGISTAIAADSPTDGDNVASWKNTSLTKNDKFKIGYYNMGGGIDYQNNGIDGQFHNMFWDSSNYAGNDIICNETASNYKIYLKKSTYKTAINQDVTVTLKQRLNGVESALDSSPLTGNTDIAYKDMGTGLPSSASLDLLGYTHSEWHIESHDGSLLDTNSAPTGNVTLFVTYTGINYSVSFFKNGADGDEEMPDQTGFVYGTSTALSQNAFTYTGYDFIGWATSADGEKEYDDQESVTDLTTTVGAIVPLYAKWQAHSYSITYNLDGGDNYTGAPSSYTIKDSTITLGNPTRTNYDFLGWYNNSTFSGNPVTQIPAGSTGDVELWAKWRGVDVNVTYNLNKEGSLTPTGKTVKYQETYGDLPTPEAVEGRRFVGWYSDASGGDPVTSSTTVTNASNHSIYAHWEDAVTYALTYYRYYVDFNTSSTDANTTSIGNKYEGQVVDLTKVADPTASNYRFAGWFNNATCTGEPIKSYTMVGEAHSLYAKMIRQYNVNVNVNDANFGSATASADIADTGSSITLTATPNEHYHFVEWNDGDKNAIRSISITNSDVTYTATFAIDTFTITWKSEDGTQTLETDSTVKYGSTPSFDGSTPTKSATAEWSYAFDGWSASAGGTLVSPLPSVSDNATYYAHFSATKRSYAITGSVNGGNGSVSPTSPGSKNYGTTVTFTATPNTGYHVLKWTVDGDVVLGNTSTSYEHRVTGAAEIQVYFEINSYDVTVNTNGNYGTATASSTSVTHGGTVTLTATANWGYQFSHWVTPGGNITTNPYTTSSITDDVEYTAVFYALYYVYDANGKLGDGPHAYLFNGDKTAYGKWPGQVMTAIPSNNKLFYIVADPSWEYVVFSKTTETYSDMQSEDLSTSENAGKVFNFTGQKTGNWSNSLVIVSFDGNGASGSMEDVYIFNTGKLPAMNDSFTRETYYRFLGWNASSSASSASILDAGNVTYVGLSPTNHRKTLYAIWDTPTFTITWQNEDGTILETDTSVPYNSTPVYNGSTPTKADDAGYTYTFNTWSPAISVVVANATYTATYTPTGKLFSVSFYQNNSADDNAQVDGSPIDERHGNTYTLPGDPERVGYTFAGWWTARSNGTQVTESTTVTITAAQILYAHWTVNTFTIAFNKNGGSGTVASVTAAYDNTQSLPENSFTKTGYTFQGWATASDGSVAYTDLDTMEISEVNAAYVAAGGKGQTYTLYAVWQIKTYTITFSSNGGDGGILGTYYVQYNDLMPSLAEDKGGKPTKVGHDFAGYEYNGTLIYTSGLSTSHRWTRDTADSYVLTARWTAHTWTITLDATTNGGSITPDTFEHTYGIPDDLSARVPTKADYVFDAWYTAADNTGVKMTTIPATLDEALTLFAHFKMEDGFVAGEVIYLVPNNDWTKDDANFAVYFQNGETSKWVKMEKVAGEGSYKATVPTINSIAEWKIIFVRVGPDWQTSYGRNKGDNQHYTNTQQVWNQTHTSGFVTRGSSDSNKDVYVLADSGWDDVSGTWKKHIDTDTYTFYYVDNRGTWTKPGAYAWDSNHENAQGNDDGYYFPSFRNRAWPGVVMSHPDEPFVKNVGGIDYTIPITYVWVVTVSKSFNRIIFNCGTSANGNADQTIDMQIATSGTDESKAHDNWFFVLDGNYDLSDKATGLWKETILPVSIYASYFDQKALIATLETDLGWSCFTFGNEKYTPTPDNGRVQETLYYGHNQTGTFYSTSLFMENAAIKYFTDPACTQEFDVGSDYCPQNCILYVKYVANTSTGYVTFYLDYANTGDNAWNNTSECYFHLGTNASKFAPYTPSNNNVWSTAGFTGCKISSCLYRVTVPANSYWFAFNDQVDSRNNTTDQFGTNEIGISAGSVSVIFASNGTGEGLYRKVATATDKDTSSFGTAMIQISGQSPITMGIGGGATNNYFIYENGVNVNPGSTVLVHVADSSIGDMPEYLDGTKYTPSIPSYLGVQFTVTNVPNSWETPYIYAWDAEENPYVAFPGVPMDTTATAGTYTFTLPAGYTQVIFSNGTSSQQTKDLALNYGQNVWSIGSFDGGVNKYNATNSPYSSETPMKLVTLERARLNFYVTNAKRLSIASVPILGNGYYIMTGSSGKGFTSGMKLYSSADGTSAAYDHFKVAARTSYYIRSYIDAVDKEYRTIVFDDTNARDSFDVTDPNPKDATLSMLITSKSTLPSGNHFDFKVDTEGRVHVATSSGDTSSFFRIGNLEADLFGANNTARPISDQRTSLVLKVTATLTNAHEMDFSAVVTPANGLGSIAGAAMYVTDTALGDPYNYMRNKYLTDLTVLGNERTVINDLNSFEASPAEDKQTLYIYLLFDYVILPSNIPGTNVNTAGTFNVVLQAKQVVEDQA